jgi:hypothetical protein
LLLGLPFTVLFVVEWPVGWNIHVRAGTGGPKRFTVSNGRAAAMRAAIQENREADL